MFPKIVVPPNHPFVHRVFHYVHHPFWGFCTYFWFNTPYISVRKFFRCWVVFRVGMIFKNHEFCSPQVLPPSWGGLTQACECAGGGGHETKGVHEPEGAAVWKWKDAYMKERSCRSWNMWFFGNGKSEWYVFFPLEQFDNHISLFYKILLKMRLLFSTGGIG